MAKISANNIQNGAITLSVLDDSLTNTLISVSESAVIIANAYDAANTALAAANINASSLGGGGGGSGGPPKITNVQIADASYNILDDTAANTNGGYIVITGSGFNTTSNVIIDSLQISTVTFVDSTTLRVQIPSLPAASYAVYVVNNNGGTAIRPNGLTTSSFPVWGTNETLDAWPRNYPMEVNLNATSDSSLTYANTSILPDGTSLLANGYFFGTASPVANTTYTFDVRVTDSELQDAVRTFTISALTIDLLRLWTVGYNNNGQLGESSILNRSSPTQIGSKIDWIDTTTAYNASFAIKSGGTLWAWGNNSQGQLGQNNIINRSSPVQIGSGTTWLKIASSWYGCVAVKTDGTLWTWGQGASGQLGLNDVVNRSSPTQLGILTNWTSKISGGLSNFVAIKSDGTMWTWGQNNFGHLGVNNILNRSSPTQVGNSTTWRDAEISQHNLIATTTSGTLWMSGHNGAGQLGRNDKVYRSSPIQIGTDSNWSLISSNRQMVAAVKTTGTLWTWGLGAFGGLGRSDQIYRSSPTQVGALTNWNRAVKCGFPGVIAIKTNGTLWRWGNNGQGQLGLNDVSYRSSPVQVGTNTNWTSIGSQFFLHWSATTRN